MNDFVYMKVEPYVGSKSKVQRSWQDHLGYSASVDLAA